MLEAVQYKSENIKKIILILSALSGVLLVLSRASYFLYLDGNDELAFYLPSFWGWVNLIVSLAPYLLFAAYLLVLQNKPNSHIFVAVVLGLVAFEEIFYILYDCFSGYYGSFLYRLLNYNLRQFLFSVALAVLLILAIMEALKGFPRKIFLTIAMGLFAAQCCHYLYYNFRVLEGDLYYGNYLSILSYLGRNFGSLLFSISMILFGWNAKIKSVLKPTPGRGSVPTSAYSPWQPSAPVEDPQQALRALQADLEHGRVTEKEYKARRAEIIRRL